MQYLLLIYTNESNDPQPGTAEFDAMMSGYFAFTDEVSNAGIMDGGNALKEVATATTVRLRNDSIQATDGPFAETKEQLGGYYLLNCENIDQAIAYAAKIPSAKWGSIEVRPIMDYSAE